MLCTEGLERIEKLQDVGFILPSDIIDYVVKLGDSAALKSFFLMDAIQLSSSGNVKMSDTYCDWNWNQMNFHTLFRLCGMKMQFHIGMGRLALSGAGALLLLMGEHGQAVIALLV